MQEGILQAANWYAIQVRPRSEFLTAKILVNKGFEPFVPQYKAVHSWSDRKVELELPLITGYIFCRFNPEVRLPIMTTAGVVRIVGTGKCHCRLSSARWRHCSGSCSLAPKLCRIPMSA